MTDLIKRLRSVAMTDYGAHTLEGLELLQAADMLDLVGLSDDLSIGARPAVYLVEMSHVPDSASRMIASLTTAASGR